jgi:hypothetical protein
MQNDPSDALALRPRGRGARRWQGVAMAAAASAIFLLPALTGSITYTNSTSAVDNNTKSVVLTVPTGLQGGDFLLAQVTFLKGSTVTVSAPAGWTLALRTNQAGKIGQAVYWHAYANGDPAQYTWTLSSNQLAAGAILAYRGVDLGAPIDVSAGLATATTGSIPVPSVTASVAGDMLVAFMTLSTQTTVNPVAGMVTRADDVGIGGGGGIVAEADEALLGAAGATGAFTATTTYSKTDKDAVGQVLALRVVAGAAGAPAGIAYRNEVDNGASNQASITVNVPTGVQAGDLLVAQIAVNHGTDATITAPSGWTLVLRTDQSNKLGQAIYRHAWVSGDPASYTWTFSANQQAAGAILAYGGVDATSPIDVSAGLATASTASIPAPSATTTAAGDMELAFLSISTQTSINVVAGMTTRADDVGIGGGGGVTIEANEKQLGAAGATGAFTATTGYSNTDKTSVGQVVALRARTIGFSSSSSTVAEGAGTVNIPVTLSSIAAGSSTVDYAVTGGTAQGGADFTLVAGTLNLAAGATTANIPLVILQDNIHEATETVAITLSNPSGPALGSITVYTLSITDDDPVPTVAFSSATSSALEGDGDVQLDATLSNPTAFQVDVNFAVTGGTASLADYTLASGTLSFAPLDTTQSITLGITNDDVAEADETVAVTISSPSQATLGTTTVHTHTILNDDGPLIVVATDPVSAAGVTQTGARWGAWSGAPGGVNVAAGNYLKITNNAAAGQQVSVDFTPTRFTGTTTTSEIISIDNNVQFAWWEGSASSKPADGTFTYGSTAGSGAATFTFAAHGDVLWVTYRVVALPDPLVDQPYEAAYTAVAV